MATVARLRRLAGRGLRAAGLRRAGSTDQRVQELRADRARLKDRLATATAARDSHRDRADSLAAELDAARAAGDAAAGRDRPDLAYLFIVTYGRSGSTLLQGVLSATPGVVIRGENGGVLTRLFDFHETVRHHRERLARPTPLPPSHPWWGIDGYPEATALRDMRLLMLEAVLRPEPSTRVAGYKEIDWPSERMPEFLDFVRQVFPGARFVLNTRDLSHVAASKWWATRPDPMTELEAMEKRFVAALEGLGADSFYRVHYDDYVADPTVLHGLFEWLGEEFDEARVRAVMDVRHSY